MNGLEIIPKKSKIAGNKHEPRIKRGGKNWWLSTNNRLASTVANNFHLKLWILTIEMEYTRKKTSPKWYLQVIPHKPLWKKF